MLRQLNEDSKLLTLNDVKKLSICGNCYFILTLLGVCHEIVNFFAQIMRQ